MKTMLMLNSGAMARATVAVLGLLAGSAACAQAPNPSSWSLEVGVSGARAADIPLQVALGPTVQVGGNTALSTGQAVRLAVGRQIPRTDEQSREVAPWRLELELWQHRADRESVSVGLLKVPRTDTLEHTALMLNVLWPLVQSDAKGAHGQPDWRAWVGAGLGIRQTRLPDASTTSCQCLPARSDTSGIGQLKFQVERRVGEAAFLQFNVAGLRVNGVNTDSARFPVTRYGDQTIAEFGVALRWVWK